MTAFAPIETERLLLDSFRPTEAALVSRLGGDPAVARYAARLPSPYPEDVARRWITATLNDFTSGLSFVFALRRRENGALVGAAGLQPEGGVAEVGYWLGQRYWHKGYATEAVRRLVAFAFETLGVTHVRAKVHVDNAPSMRVLERAGMRLEGQGHMAFPARAMVAPVSIYGCAADDPDRPTAAGPRVVLVAAVVLADAEGRVLLAQRPAGKVMAGLWEFPGGKLGRGEPVKAAAIRELEEELGVVVTEGALAPLATASHAYEDFHLLMPLLLCRSWAGSPEGRESQKVTWVPTAALDSYPMPPADLPLIPVLRAVLAE